MQERILFFQLNWMAAHNSSIQFGWKKYTNRNETEYKKKIFVLRDKLTLKLSLMVIILQNVALQILLLYK